MCFLFSLSLPLEGVCVSWGLRWEVASSPPWSPWLTWCPPLWDDGPQTHWSETHMSPLGKCSAAFWLCPRAPDAVIRTCLTGCSQWAPVSCCWGLGKWLWDHLQKKSVSWEQLLTYSLDKKHPLFLGKPLFLQRCKGTLPSCSAVPPNPEATKVLYFQLTAMTNSPKVLTLPGKPQGSSWLQSTLQAAGWPMPTFPWVCI